MNDTIADRDAEIALIMAMGSATVEEASKALDENDGNVDRAMAQLYDTKPAQHRTNSTTAKPSYIQRHEDSSNNGIDKLPTKLERSPADGTKGRKTGV